LPLSLALAGLRVVRVRTPRGGARLGVAVGDEVALLRVRGYGGGRGFLSLIRDAEKRGVEPSKYLEDLVWRSGGGRRLRYSDLEAGPVGGYRLLIPVVPPEVWGAGVTYLRSRDAREVETRIKGIYDYVYEAPRPEIFFKATPSRCVGPGEVAYIRGDSSWSVPEPELALILDARHRIIGFTVGNDLSARDIEGENPLYLPQAKIYRGCCALGPAIALPGSIGDPKNLRVEMRVVRGGEVVFRGSTSTAYLKRSLEELVEYLTRCNVVPGGAVLLTGTGIVPPDDFALKSGDIVEVEVENIGVLRNRIEQLSIRDRRS